MVRLRAAVPEPNVMRTATDSPVMGAPAAEIETRSRAIVYDALRAKALAGHLRQVKALTGDTAREYAGRFLIELIQNGYDAQPAGTSTGRLAVRLHRAEGPYGVVYVANTGRPFSIDDVIAISELAQSTKQPGEGIGHKGLGFKSVLQACRWPEIYSLFEQSQVDAASLVDGYCFRFARPRDIRELAGEAAPADVARVERDLSPYVLPIPIADVPDVVADFRRDGSTRSSGCPWTLTRHCKQLGNRSLRFATRQCRSICSWTACPKLPSRKEPRLRPH